MDEDSPRDKLLKACQAPFVLRRNQGNKSLEDNQMHAEAALSLAQQAQNATEKTNRRLDAYLEKELPVKLVQAFEKEAGNRIAGALGPLDEAVRKASRRIDSCADNLFRLSWNARIIWTAVLIGIGTVMLGAILVRWTIIEGRFNEERRYELSGRQLAARMDASSPKERERIRKWLEGGKLQ